MINMTIKAKQKKNNEWVIGYYLFYNSTYYICVQNEKNKSIIDYYEIDPDTICRNLGINDRNGNLIWENDIVKDKTYKYKVRLYTVVYDNEEGSWSLGNPEPLYSIGSLNSEKYEVIGNIFDNPELL